jgi:hypothetical protein
MTASRYPVYELLMAACLALAAASPADAQQAAAGCLYGQTTVGPEASVVVPCVDADPLNIANDPDVRTVMKSLGLKPGTIRFKGCKSLRFRAAPDGVPSDHRYVITYPTDAAGSYLAPITHELAHVLQMEMAGGLLALTATFASKRVELGADYLTGVVFSQSLKQVSLNEFQHNLALIGLYVELDANAHGTPSQRVAAFRFGVFQKFDSVHVDMRKASDDFQVNLYGRIIQL